ncbi:hypothetical protein [Rhodococcus sp. JG-3]|uniref:hypothetical protein n=1 Tax=Rhodococcus sp. JG-3 TaxID=1305835 RepID=UPI00040B6C05|nr:hypothetical protein [Rhodococcus sp. JG-3]
MPMITTQVDCPTPTITRSGSFTTIRFDRGLALQLDHDEWTALVEAVVATAAVSAIIDHQRAITRDENAVRSDAELREALQ